jgi:aspartyl/glutamyl-tRNA(Asn/Gln) amidotransferase C subunit
MDPGVCDPAELARLARLGLDEEERSLFQQQLYRMVETFNLIGDLPTAGIEPFAHPGDQLLTIREDEPSPGRGSGGHLAVPRLFGPRPGGKR